MKTLTKNPARLTRNNSTLFYNPLDRFFRNDFLDFWDGTTMAETIPSINVTEEKNQYKIEMAAPGLKKDDFNIGVDGNLITISSEKKYETKNREEGAESDSGYSRKEYNYSSFSRSFNIPEHADTDRIVAKYNDGILTLDIPKKPEAQKSKTQKIMVQ